MKKAAIAGILTILILLVSSSGSAFAQTRTPGVSVGDTFKYTYSLQSNLNNPGYTLPSFITSLLEQANSVDWVQIKITNISGPSVTAQMTTQYKNGTQQSDTGVTEVSTGIGNLTMFLIAANLNSGDQIYNGNPGTINETVTRNYPTGSRALNHQSTTMEYNVSQEELSGFNITGPLHQTNTQDTYWDKQSGSLTEMSYKMETTSTLLNADISVDVALVESNVFTVPEYPVMIIVITALVASTIAATLFSRKAKRYSIFASSS